MCSWNFSYNEKSLLYSTYWYYMHCWAIYIQHGMSVLVHKSWADATVLSSLGKWTFRVSSLVTAAKQKKCFPHFPALFHFSNLFSYSDHAEPDDTITYTTAAVMLQTLHWKKCFCIKCGIAAISKNFIKVICAVFWCFLIRFWHCVNCVLDGSSIDCRGQVLTEPLDPSFNWLAIQHIRRI